MEFDFCVFCPFEGLQIANKYLTDRISIVTVKCEQNPGNRPLKGVTLMLLNFDYESKNFDLTNEFHQRCNL